MIETNIGGRVRALREAVGMGQEQLKAILRLDNRQSVSDLERGKRRLTAEELITVVDTFGVSFEQLTNPFLLSGKESFSWRQRDVPLADLNAFEARAGEWIGAYHELNRLNETPLKKLLPRIGLTHTSSFEDAIDAGEAVAEELALGERPALGLTDAVEKRLGILVLMVDAIEGVSGAACRLRTLNAVLINRHERGARRNSDLAHELFHLLTWEQMKPERIESSEEPWDRTRTPTRSQQRNVRIENIADNFASGLLMPSSELDRIGDPQGDPVEWLTAAAAELGVTARGLKWRLVNSSRHAQLSGVANEALNEAARARGEEETPLPFSARFIETLIHAIEGGHISAARAARLTDMSKSELGALCEAYGLDRPTEL